METLTSAHMQQVNKHSIIENSRLRVVCNLLFYVVALMASCKTDSGTVDILWNEEKAIGVHIPTSLVKDMPDRADNGFVTVRLQQPEAPSIAGNYRFGEGIRFDPLIPFTRGLTYEVFAGATRIASFKIPLAETAGAPEVRTIHPEVDALPKNLLKFYIVFSQPMRTGQSAGSVVLIRNGKDTLRNSFLDLQPELWNDSNTVLTLWLDPGRVKRDLQPNLKLGEPLGDGIDYELIIKKQWQDQQGRDLQAVYRKKFRTGKRDTLSPDPKLWSLTIPVAESRQPLQIDCKEPLDHFLTPESLQILDKDGNLVKGDMVMGTGDRLAYFTPQEPWKNGKHTLVIEARLEDLAANNLNRLFDQDLMQKKRRPDESFYTRNFHIGAITSGTGKEK